MRRVALVLVTILITAVVPATASAQRCVAPPGTGAVDQYCEVVPAAGGNSGGDSGAASSSPAVSGRDARTLARQGEDGRALLGFVESSGPRPSGEAGERATPRGEVRGASDSRSALDYPPNNPLAAITSAASNGSQLGSTLVWIVLALAIAAIGAALARGSRRGGQG